MLAEKMNTSGVWNMDTLYSQAMAGIEIILKHRYKMKASDAEHAIAISPLKELFKKNAEMSAHTSNEAWARDIYEFWKKKNKM